MVTDVETLTADVESAGERSHVLQASSCVGRAQPCRVLVAGLFMGTGHAALDYAYSSDLGPRRTRMSVPADVA